MKDFQDAMKQLDYVAPLIEYQQFKNIKKAYKNGHMYVESAKEILKDNRGSIRIKGTGNLWKNADLLDELARSGAKYSPDDVLAVTKTGNGKLVWLETGNSKAGMQHILNHADDFAKKGIQQNQIQDLVME